MRTLPAQPVAGACLWQPGCRHHRRLPHRRLQQRRGEQLRVGAGCLAWNFWNALLLPAVEQRQHTLVTNPPLHPFLYPCLPLQLAVRFVEAWSSLSGFERSTPAPAKYERCMEAALSHQLRWVL